MGRGALLEPLSRCAEQCCLSGPAQSLCVLTHPFAYLVTAKGARRGGRAVRGSPAWLGWGWGQWGEKRVHKCIRLCLCRCAYVAMYVHPCRCASVYTSVHICMFVHVLHAFYVQLCVHRCLRACLISVHLCTLACMCQMEHVYVSVCSAHMCMHLSLRVHMGTCTCMCLHGLFYLFPLSPRFPRWLSSRPWRPWPVSHTPLA